ncbi:MAG: BolA/IbaG family iron-sulfur metabolism protein [Porticoccaceae bacterium]|nr:BolA/IbaG family iron-sulfur metabolism protein [Porticoccaceae bacterium]
MGPVESVVSEKLIKAFSPSYLDVINESGMHNVPAGSESHFKVIISSEFFDKKSPVKRHQAIYSVLAEELKISIHALSLLVYSPQEWKQVKTVPQSPNCMGGSKKP